MATSANACRATTSAGTPCRAPAGSSGWCFVHDPALGAQRAEARRRGGRRTRVPHSTAEPPPAQAGSLDDARAILAYALSETLVTENSHARSRLLVSIAVAVADLWRIGELEARLAALERVIKPGDGR